MKRKILVGTAAAAAALGLTFGVAAPASAVTNYYTVNCSMYASNLNSITVSNFSTGYITAKAYAANGALIASKYTNAKSFTVYGNRTSYTRFVVTGSSFSVKTWCAW